MASAGTALESTHPQHGDLPDTILHTETSRERRIKRASVNTSLPARNNLDECHPN